MNEPALLVSGLHKTYSNGKTALKGVDLTVPQGSFYALLGPNGAGKSTLINILADIVRPGPGTATLFGHHLFRERSWCKRNMGVVPQEVAFDPFFSVHEVLRTTCGLFGQRPDPVWINRLLEQLELAAHAKKNTRQLSGGMRRRLLVAQALVHRPPLVILDEPTAGVDVEIRHRLWDFMRELNNQGTTILLTTHYLEEAEELCEFVAILHGGRLLTARPMGELMREAAGTYLWLRYGEGWHLTPEDRRFLAEFEPRIHDGVLCLTLKRTGLNQSTFHDAYEAAVTRFGPPVDAGVREEDLEDVFLRLTREHEA